MATATDRYGSEILTTADEQVRLTPDQAAGLTGALLRYCPRCRAVWPWKGGPDPCPCQVK
jgi:hypothetical protein